MNDRLKYRVWDSSANAYVPRSQFILLSDGTLIQEIGGEEVIWESTQPEFCTGLKDKNGKLIYEGDIIVKSDVSAIGYSRTRVCKVHWHNDWLSWAITTQYGDTYELSEFEPKQYEIIGNIHEDADLLEKNND